MAHIPVVLQESLQPSEIGELVVSAAEHKNSLGEEILLAVRFYIAERNKAAAVAATMALAQPGGAQ